MRSLEVHCHILCLAQKKTDDKEDNGNLRHRRYILRLARVLTKYFPLRWYFFRITAKLLNFAGLEVMWVLLEAGGKVEDLDGNL